MPRTLVDILDATTSAYPEATAIKNGKEQLINAELAQVIAKAKQLKVIGLGSVNELVFV
jgi:non-ribosomal peptide synthetase component E (peptide arylation enzyme)